MIWFCTLSVVLVHPLFQLSDCVAIMSNVLDAASLGSRKSSRGPEKVQGLL